MVVQLLEKIVRDDDVKGVAEVFGLLGEPSRLKIVVACLDGPMGAGEIAETAGLSQSLALVCPLRSGPP